MKRGMSGAVGELSASIALMRNGYDVYRAQSPHAPFDLIAHKDGVLLRVEVRVVARRKDGSVSPATKPGDQCDLYAFVDADGVVEFAQPEAARGDRRIRRGGL